MNHWSNMTPRIKKIQYKKDYIFHLQYDDDFEGDVDLQSLLWGEAFDELKNKDKFKKAFIDETTGSISWPNGSDIAPETLYKKIIVQSNSQVSTVR